MVDVGRCLVCGEPKEATRPNSKLCRSCDRRPTRNRAACPTCGQRMSRALTEQVRAAIAALGPEP